MPFRRPLPTVEGPEVESQGDHLATAAIRPADAGEQSVVDDFHRLYYDSDAQTWQSTRWMGVPTQKCPLDCWIYQELLWEVAPDLIVETGTNRGGSALFLAHMCDLMGRGHVLTIDVTAQPGLPSHPRIKYLRGSSTAPDVLAEVRCEAEQANGVMVILDSDHSAAHVGEELRLYAPLVTIGSYMVVEDTNVNGHPVLPGFGPGPMEAVREFMAQRADFVADKGSEKYMMTFNPGGFLRRVAAGRT